MARLAQAMRKTIIHRHMYTHIHTYTHLVYSKHNISNPDGCLINGVGTNTHSCGKKDPNQILTPSLSDSKDLNDFLIKIGMPISIISE